MSTDTYYLILFLDIAAIIYAASGIRKQFHASLVSTVNASGFFFFFFLEMRRGGLSITEVVYSTNLKENNDC